MSYFTIRKLRHGGYGACSQSGEKWQSPGCDLGSLALKTMDSVLHCDIHEGREETVGTAGEGGMGTERGGRAQKDKLLILSFHHKRALHLQFIYSLNH